MRIAPHVSASAEFAVFLTAVANLERAARSRRHSALRWVVTAAGVTQL